MNSLTDVQLRIVTQWDNFYRYDVYLERQNSTGKVQLVGGYSAFILHELQIYLNFTYILLTEAKYSYNFSLNVEKYNTDLFMGSFGVFERRAKVANPTFVTGRSSIVALLNHEYEESLVSNFLKPFTPSLWGAIGIFLIVLSLSFYLVIKISSNAIISQSGRRAMESFFDTLSIFLQKYSMSEFNLSLMRENPWRILECITGFTALVIMNCYSGVIVSLMAVKVYEINSLEALLNSKYKINLEVGYNNGSAIQGIAEALKHVPIMRKLLNAAKESGFVYESFEASIITVSNSKSAYVIDLETAYDTIQGVFGHMPCTWNTVSIAGIKYPWSFFINKKRPNIRAAVNEGILRLDQSGLLDRGRKYWIPRFTQCYSRILKLPFGVPVTFGQIYWSLSTFILGFLLANLILVTEKITYNCRSYNNIIN